MIPTEEMKKLRAFNGDAAIKKQFVQRVLAHQKADRIEKGHYWENGKGCAVGCTLELSRDQVYDIHAQYQPQLGIPEALARLEDYLFEAMPNDKAMKFPAEFLKAIPVGADLSRVPAKFIVATLKDVVKLKDVKDDKQVVKVVLDAAQLWEKVIAGKEVKSAAWSAAESAAWSAARSAAAYKMSRTLIKLLKNAK